MTNLIIAIADAPSNQGLAHSDGDARNAAPVERGRPHLTPHWCADDQPFALTVPGMMSVPYSIEVNDISLFAGKSLSGEAFYQIVVDQFDQLYKDGEKTGRVMSLCLHPFIINQPFRHKYLEKALQYIANHDGVWLTTSDDIAAHYAKNYMSAN